MCTKNIHAARISNVRPVQSQGYITKNLLLLGCSKTPTTPSTPTIPSTYATQQLPLLFSTMTTGILHARAQLPHTVPSLGSRRQCRTVTWVLPTYKRVYWPDTKLFWPRDSGSQHGWLCCTRHGSADQTIMLQG